MSKNEYIKSAFPYIGGKYKLLPQIIPLLPTDTELFVDLFGGGFNVGINAPCKKVVYNDTLKPVVEIIKHIYNTKTEEMLSEIQSYIDNYSLTKENKKGYLEFRTDYNSHLKENKSNPMELFALICYGFNNQIRFNSKGEFNMPFGKDRSSFNPVLKEKFIAFAEAMHNKEVIITSMDFTQLKVEKLTSKDFVYLDPPYLGSLATYNEQKGWSETEETALLKLCDELTEHKVRFALSNNLKYENNILKNWLEENKEKYIAHYLGSQYTNCNYHKKDKSKDIEVLITNY